jgi:hypothetical protein
MTIELGFDRLVFFYKEIPFATASIFVSVLKVCPEMRELYDQPESHFSFLGWQL